MIDLLANTSFVAWAVGAWVPGCLARQKRTVRVTREDT